MLIHLPEDLERFVNTTVASGRFASELDVITEAIRLLRLVEEQPGSTLDGAAPALEPVWKRVIKNMENLPDSIFDGIPTDGSAQLDHYVYGTPRQANP